MPQYGTRLKFKFNGAKLKDLRTQKGLSRSDLAKILNSANSDWKISADRVYKWEKGIIRPTFEVMRELSYFFGVTDDYWKSDDTKKKEMPLKKDEKKKTPGPAVTLVNMKKSIEDLEELSIELDEKIRILNEKTDRYEREVERFQKYFDDIATEVESLRDDNDDRLSNFTANFIVSIIKKIPNVGI